MGAAALEPIKLVVLQGTSFCNLDCAYCDLSPASRRVNARMGLPVVEHLFRELFASPHLNSQVTVVWHSGEPLTLPIAYYEAAIATILRLQRDLGREDVALHFDFQTNGVLIDQNWCDFFTRHRARLNLGVSCDGPPALHDAHRVNWGRRGTHRKTLAGMDLLQHNGIPYNVIAVVTRLTLEQADDFYAFFHERRDHLSGFHFNILAAADGTDADLSYAPCDRPLYYAFFRRLLDLVRAADRRGEGFAIRNFSHGLARILASQAPAAPAYLEDASAPLRCLNVDTAGYVTTFYAGLGREVAPDLYGDGLGLSIGNILHTPFADMVASAKLERMREDFRASTAGCRTACDYAGVCSGGFELTQRMAFGAFRGGETPECVIAVKALTDALLDDIGEHLAEVSGVA